ncbi:hypothetical protein ACOMHN_013358 [Nucella lapillus]
MLLLCCVVVVVAVVPLMAEGRADWNHYREVVRKRHEMWAQWKNTHGKEYTRTEEAYRRRVFLRNVKEIQKHNCKYPVSVSYYRGLNKFSDLTVEEYRSDYLSDIQQVALGNGPYRNLCTRAIKDSHTSPASVNKLPKSVDWRSKGWVSPVKDQLQCKSAWAFSAALCRANASQELVTISGYKDLDWGSEQELKHATARIGPVSVAVDASHISFMTYAGGVYYEPACTEYKLIQCMLVVGYGTYQGQDYWLVKNSWSSSWGLNGYIMMARNRGNMCGIASSASYAFINP